MHHVFIRCLTTFKYSHAHYLFCTFLFFALSRLHASAVVQRGCTALHLAAEGGRLERVAAMLEAGADVNAVDKVSLRLSIPMHITVCAPPFLFVTLPR